ncbi:hypothetical protein IW261DRAFT_1567085 [Armillaria novae-zelandiae]|uniref:Uncharacterized protein n=1 Tax=Armillaria novae-zelandiae TaxID=153914 RepID=A0AA39U7V6_9AGAR|nr:hypothetical protein IW261DRAFT_1567085 [Armillaria novae-zelandiae]
MASFIQLFRAIWAFISSVLFPSMDKQPILPTHTPTTTPVKSKPQPPSQQHSLLQPIRTQPPTHKTVKIGQETDRSLSFSEKKKIPTSVSGKPEKTHSRARHAPRSPPPEICIQDWSTVGINMADLYIPTSSTILPPPGSEAVSSSNSPSSPSRKSPALPSLATASSKSLTSPTPPAPPESCNSDSEPLSFAAKSSEQISPNPSSSTVSASDPPSSKLPNNDAGDPKSSVATENIKENIVIKSEEPSTPTPSVSFVAGCSKALPLTAYATSAVSAMSSYFWDPSPAETDETRGIPPPLYSSSPPRRQCLSYDTSNSPQLLSRLPYPDLFDFSMYISEFPSGDSIYSISMNYATNPLRGSDSSGMSTSGGSPQRDSYRSAAFSRTLSGLRQSPFTLRKSVVLMQAIKQQAAQPNASFRSSTCKETTHDYGVSMDRSIEDRLQEACAGLSRGEWTLEEFLKLLTEV